MPRSRPFSVFVAVFFALAFAGASVECYLKSSQARDEAEWYLARGNASGAEYATTFDNTYADQQTTALEHHHAALERAHFWQRFEMLGVLAAFVSGFASYVFWLLFRLRQQLVSVEPLGAQLTP